ncbi:MAG: hypothetical protein EA402_00490 [Planctomycetota bacterium]|nr:MAG: hypothetical protein EA402_00490 [Planctomycetota bacterium]
MPRHALHLVAWLHASIEQQIGREKPQDAPVMGFNEWTTAHGWCAAINPPEDIRAAALALLADIESHKDQLGEETGHANQLRPICEAIAYGGLLWAHGGRGHRKGTAIGSIKAIYPNRPLIATLAQFPLTFTDATSHTRHGKQFLPALFTACGHTLEWHHDSIQADQSEGLNLQWVVDGPTWAKDERKDSHKQLCAVIGEIAAKAEKGGDTVGIITHKATAEKLAKGQEMALAADPDAPGFTLPPGSVVGWYGAHDRGVNVFENCELMLVAGAHRPPFVSCIPMAALRQHLGLPAAPGIEYSPDQVTSFPRRTDSCTVLSPASFVFVRPPLATTGLTRASCAPRGTDKRISAEYNAATLAHRLQLIGRARAVSRAIEGKTACRMIVIGLEPARGLHRALSPAGEAWTYHELRADFQQGSITPEELAAFLPWARSQQMSMNKALAYLKARKRGMQREEFSAHWNYYDIMNQLFGEGTPSGSDCYNIISTRNHLRQVPAKQGSQPEGAAPCI